MKDCPFCYDLQSALEIADGFHSTRQNSIEVYSAALVCETYYDKVDFHHFSGQITHRHNPLNYCPCCGKKINITELQQQINDYFT